VYSVEETAHHSGGEVSAQGWVFNVVTCQFWRHLVIEPDTTGKSHRLTNKNVFAIWNYAFKLIRQLAVKNYAENLR